eukprot:m.155155 g.155155  ORF g.155155 m.155155 type:complete len:773 (-) comp15088_c0_seq1:288-2606(-)
MADKSRFLETLLQGRGPGKRKVKASAEVISDFLDAGAGNGSDDSESDMDWAGANADKIANHSDGSSDTDKEDDSSEDDDDDDDTDIDNDNGENSNGETNDGVKKQKPMPKNSGSTKVTKPKPEKSKQLAALENCDPETIVANTSGKCCICMEPSNEDEELQVCDGCGLEVHGTCYGIHPADELEECVITSSDNTSSLFWFCEVCKTGAVAPTCIMCPNEGGALKELVVKGKWIHIVCAFYIEQCRWGEEDSLSPMLIGDVPSSLWGSKNCSLCETSETSSQGVCVPCDAGMCRNYMHPLCGQKLGLLQEVKDSENSEQPYFVHCLQHADKVVTKAACREWPLLEKRWKSLEEIAQEKLKTDVQLKLALKSTREVYDSERAKWLNANREALGQSQRVLDAVLMAAREKARVAETSIEPSLDVRFIEQHNSYSRRLEQVVESMKRSKTRHEVLIKEAKCLQEDVDNLENQLITVREKKVKQCQLLEGIVDGWKLMGKNVCVPRTITTAQNSPQKNPKTTTVKDTEKSPDKRKNSLASLRCDVCKKTNDIDMMVTCDMCSRSYHFGCHDPPLKKKPVKNKFSMWQCSSCDSSESESNDEANLIITGKRSTRRSVDYMETAVPITNKRCAEKSAENQPKKRQTTSAPSSKPIVQPVANSQGQQASGNMEKLIRVVGASANNQKLNGDYRQLVKKHDGKHAYTKLCNEGENFTCNVYFDKTDSSWNIGKMSERKVFGFVRVDASCEEPYDVEDNWVLSNIECFSEDPLFKIEKFDLE